MSSRIPCLQHRSTDDNRPPRVLLETPRDHRLPAIKQSVKRISAPKGGLAREVYDLVLANGPMDREEVYAAFPEVRPYKINAVLTCFQHDLTAVFVGDKVAVRAEGEEVLA